ncbi:ACT domain-containing protein, partial [Pseudoalteromonas lipolytica]
LGAKVLHIRSVEAAGKYNIPLRVLSSFNPDQGTLISFEEPDVQANIVSGIAFNRDESLIYVNAVPQGMENLAKILQLFAEFGIEIDMINQVNHNFEKIDYAFTVHTNDFEQALEILTSNQSAIKAESINGVSNVAKVSAVGVGMKSHSGVASLFFNALAQESIKVILISTSEIKISVLIDEKYLELAVRALHKVFLTENE